MLQQVSLCGWVYPKCSIQFNHVLMHAKKNGQANNQYTQLNSVTKLCFEGVHMLH